MKNTSTELRARVRRYFTTPYIKPKGLATISGHRHQHDSTKATIISTTMQLLLFFPFIPSPLISTNLSDFY